MGEDLYCPGNRVPADPEDFNKRFDQTFGRKDVTTNKCRHFNTCSAPLCPQDEASFGCIWFADEEICIRQTVPDWVRRQRKIAKKVKSWEVGYFTQGMLDHNCVVGVGMKGLNPDSEDSQENMEKRWFKKHPMIREKTEEEKEEARRRFRDNVLSRDGSLPKGIRSWHRG